MSFKVGQKLWCFHTEGCEWYGPYSVDWIELFTVTCENWMLSRTTDNNMYFATKEEAIGAMIKRLQQLKEHPHGS